MTEHQALGERLLAEGRAEIARLKVLKGSTPRRRARRVRRANALLALSTALLGFPLTRSAQAASTPQFKLPAEFALGLTPVDLSSTPDLADIDGDGDLDAIVGEFQGNTIVFENTGSASAPAFGAPSTNPFGLADVGDDSSPDLADIDGDGDLDAIVGAYYGSTRLFENTGSATAPAFAGPSTNSPFGLAGVYLNSSPDLADIDGDGDLDALVGEYDGNTIFFDNTGSATAPAFASPSTNPFGLADVGSDSAPDLADIDGDDDLDVLVGESNGNTLVFTNTGSATAPAFAARSTNPFGLADVGYSSTPDLADIDGDGDLDAFVGQSEGSTLVFTNTGSATAPAFAAPPTNPFGLADVGDYSSPDLADIDGDGDLDAFVGQSEGNTLFFDNTGSSTGPAFAAPSTDPFGLAYAGYRSAPDLADIDGDGDLDAFYGESEGNTIFFANTGSATAPAFAAPSTNPFGLTNVGDNSSPVLADIDGDGDIDAVVGQRYGNIFVFTNTGTATAPAFATRSTNPFGLSDVGLSSSPDLADIDGDGDLDAIVGELFGNIFVFTNTGTATAPAFAAPSTNPFGLSDVGIFSTPNLADGDRDGDLDAIVGAGSGQLLVFKNRANPPTGMALSKTKVAESKPAGTIVGTLSATDPGDTHAFSLVAGPGSADNASFRINGNKLKTAEPFDFETDPTKRVRIRATDSKGGTFERSFTITVTDVVARLAINDVVKAEGDAGTKAFTFTIKRTGDLSGPASVEVKTQNGTAKAPSDFTVLAATTVKFADAVKAKKVRVVVNGDSKAEDDEYFVVELSDPVLSTIRDGVGIGGIENDD